MPRLRGIVIAATSLLLAVSVAPAAAAPTGLSVNLADNDLTVSPSPSVFLDTTGGLFGLPGIRIDDPNADIPDSTFQGQFFETPFGTWLQVAVFDRATLKPVYVQNYPCGQITSASTPAAAETAAAPCVAAVRKDFTDHKVGASQLVVAANPDFGSPGPYGVVKALSGIGVAKVGWWGQNAALQPGTFTAVGIPGSRAGSAFQSAQSDPTPNQSAIRTLLTINNKGMYEVMPSDRIEFATDAPASTADTHVMRIGGKRVAHAVDGGGYHVAWFDRARNPNDVAIQDDFFATAKGVAEIRRMNDRIRDIAGNDRLGFVTSVGNPFPANSTYQTSIAIDDLVDSLTWLGATRNSAYGPLDRATAKGQSYTLIGHGQGIASGVENTHQATTVRYGAPRTTCRQARADAAVAKQRYGPHNRRARNAAKRAHTVCSSRRALGDTPGKRVRVPRPLRGGENNAGVAGVLSRDHIWRYEPTVVFDGDSQGEPAAAAVVYQQPTPWPGDDNPTRSEALSDIGDQAGLGKDPRGQYWTQDFGTDYWSNRLADVQAAKYDPSRGYAQADFQWAQDELVQEIKWVKEAYGFYDRMAKPYSGAGIETWAKMTATATTIDKAVGVSDAEKVAGNVMSITHGLLDVLEVIPEVGEIIGAFTALYDLAAEVTEIAVGEPLESDYSVKVGELGEQTAQRLKAAEATVRTRFARIVVSDYARLKTVGTCVGGAKTCDNRKEWQITTDGVNAAAERFQDSMSLMFYSALLPAKYNLYEMPASPRATANTAYCPISIPEVVAGGKPWKDAPANASAASRLYASHEPDNAGLNNVLVFGSPKNDTKAFNEISYPTADAVDPLFGSKGLDADPETFLRRSYAKILSGQDKFDCRWDVPSASTNAKPESRTPHVNTVGGKLFRDVAATLINDTGQPIWVAKYLEPNDSRSWTKVSDGGKFTADSKSWGPTMFRLGILFEDPATLDNRWQDEIQVINPIGAPYVWHERTAGDAHYFPLSVGEKRGQIGWRAQSWQSNGYPYNLFMRRDNDDYYTFNYTLEFSLRGRQPL